MKADIVIGLSYGDEGKGKVTHHLLKEGGYTHCLRFNGGCNAGHTIYHKGKKFVTHHIPAGVFFGVRSIIGPGCVVNLEQFKKEIVELEANGVNTTGLIYIAKNAHVITEAHLDEDREETTIGTTKRGNGPAYRDKYDRTGTRAEDVPELKNSPYLIDLYNEFYNGFIDPWVLCEGAQGFGLDIDWGDYPFVTSSHCTTGGALLNCIPPQAVHRVFGVTKAYDTYVGCKKFHGHGRVFDLLQQLGDEFGATTGRPRQCNWLDIRMLQKAIVVNGVTDLIINKVDILREVGKWNLRSCASDRIFVQIGNEQGWKQYIKKYLEETGVSIKFSDNPERI
jgi:adenylosuccinate synthase